VEVDVQDESIAEPPHEDDGAALRAAHFPLPQRATAERGEEGAGEEAENLAASTRRCPTGLASRRPGLVRALLIPSHAIPLQGIPLSGMVIGCRFAASPERPSRDSS